MKLSKDRTENIGEVYLPHMPVSKVLKSKVKKTLLKIATRRISINFFETDTFENVKVKSVIIER